MKNQKFDAKSFLNVKTLSPLESLSIKGGLEAVKDKKKQKDVKADIKVVVNV
jgi:hypothetical protein